MPLLEFTQNFEKSSIKTMTLLSGGSLVVVKHLF